MKKLLKERTRKVRMGDASVRAPKMKQWNSFSNPINERDLYLHSEKVMEELEPELERMRI